MIRRTFLQTAAAAPVALACVAHAWVIPELYAQRGANVVRPLLRNVRRIVVITGLAAAYEAPYPDPASKAGARAFPLMMPRTPGDPGAARGQRTQDALERGRGAGAVRAHIPRSTAESL